MDKLDTGDLILFDYQGPSYMYSIFASIIRHSTDSSYSHIGIVVKDPIWIDKNLKGLYLWESGWEGIPDCEDNKCKFGVQITPLYEALHNYHGIIKYRKLLKGKDYITNEKLTEINKIVHNKPYDLNIIDWVGALIRKDWTSKKTNKFWCSAFIGYVLNRLNFIDDSVDWSTLRPCDFSSSKNYLKFKNDCMYGTDIDLKL